jgi:uncharacterized protein YndB with AHSA1/START domain/effector-binding domain-containing protein
MKNVGALTITLPSDREIAMTRAFDAPRRLVWDAYTKPELMKRWGGGPPGWDLVVCEIDLRVGGSWRWVIAGPNGEKMGLGGVYQEIAPRERLVSTEKFDQPWYEGEATSRIDLAERAGKTTLTLTVQYASQKVRDAVLATPMAEGVAAGYDRLAEVLDAPLVTDAPAQLIAVVHLTIPKAEIRTAMGPGVTELRAALAAQGIPAAGSWFTHHYKIDPDIWDFDIAMPVTAPVTPTGRVRPSELAAARVARTIHRGPYEGLPSTWGALDAWVAANGLTPRPDLWECYVFGPESTTDPASFRTELNRPLVE